jgi:hypothetical protein
MTHVKGDGGVELRQRYVVFRSFLGVQEQQLLVREALDCHLKNSNDKQNNNGTATGWKSMEASSNPLPFKLGVPCGGDLTSTLPAAVEVARRAFRQALQLPPSYLASTPVLEKVSQPNIPLTGLALLYGLKASKLAHYDSPTQPGQREEWLAMMTMGRDVRFRCNDDIVQLQSGDVLVMDSMAVLHGVESIVDDDTGCDTELGLPIKSRLGILFWQGTNPVDKVDRTSFSVVDGVGSLFNDSDDDDDDDDDEYKSP